MQEFNRILKQRDQEVFPSWMERASQNRITGMKSLASGLKRDRAAVTAAPEYEWSNGPADVSGINFGRNRLNAFALAWQKQPSEIVTQGPDTVSVIKLLTQNSRQCSKRSSRV